ncbi:hypothetical protein PsorP6_003380 [Peronosclerospora sorghi]|uniref:Uncharacterized protein n=1 Tax=Peronosclerospora sorghi TaxID=230839 RepID=A0ACC0VLZ7_9STRA|nr:hypothetical protein PsorP6_003380 [Peronosclerospora sorghi]
MEEDTVGVEKTKKGSVIRKQRMRTPRVDEEGVRWLGAHDLTLFVGRTVRDAYKKAKAKLFEVARRARHLKHVEES